MFSSEYSDRLSQRGVNVCHILTKDITLNYNSRQLNYHAILMVIIFQSMYMHIYMRVSRYMYRHIDIYEFVSMLVCVNVSLFSLSVLTLSPLCLSIV